jgi:amino acid transporter
MEEENILDPIILEERKKPKRPVVITVICIIYFCFIALLLPIMITNLKTFELITFLSVIVFLLLYLMCIIEMWRMKKWAVYSFITLTVITQIFTYLMGSWNLMANIIPTICSVILLFQIKKMGGADVKE